jgi:hypothetical protein
MYAIERQLGDGVWGWQMLTLGASGGSTNVIGPAHYVLCMYPYTMCCVPCFHCYISKTIMTGLRGTISSTLRNWGVNHTDIQVGGLITREGTENVRPRSAGKHQILHFTTEPPSFLE